MRNHTVRTVLTNAQKLVNATGVPKGTIFTILVVTDGVPDAAVSNTEVALAQGMLEQFSQDQRHTTAFLRVSVSQLSRDTVRGLTLLAVIDQSSSNFWSDFTLRQSIAAALSTSTYLLNTVETNLIY